MRRLLQISVLFLTTLFFISCSSDSLAPDPSNNEMEPVMTHSDGDVMQPGLDSELHATLAQVRRATAQYRDVTVAKESGYVHPDDPPHFVPGMGYHYVNFGLMDGEVIPTQPEALVYQGNPVHEDKRKLGAVEYIIPDPDQKMSPSDLDGKFPGVDGDTWHYENEIDAWTLHAWVWYPNPEGVFHPTNPRVNQGQD